MASEAGFIFDVGQTVKIAPTSAQGTVHARLDNGFGSRQYRVIYWNNGDMKDEWVYETDLVA